MQRSQQSLSLRRQVYHPWTRTYVRLLGPCFKTGRIEPFSHHSCVQKVLRNSQALPGEGKESLLRATHPHIRFAVRRRVPQGTFTHPEASYHVPRVVLTTEPTMTHKARSITRNKIKTHSNACADAAGHHHSTQQSRQARLVPSAFLSASSGTFNSLFKVLFIFPSWYLFAIGLEPIFSLR